MDLESGFLQGTVQTDAATAASPVFPNTILTV